jgi:hypothetical protein
MSPLKKMFSISLMIFIAFSFPLSFGWDGDIAMDADMRNIQLGQTITYEGYIYGDYPIDEEPIFIRVIEKDTKKIILTTEAFLGTKAVEYFENTAWSFSFLLDTFYEEFIPGKTYVVEATYDIKNTKLEFFIQPEAESTCLEKLEGEDIMVYTDKENYEKGETIKVSGCLSERAFTNTINVTVYDPQGNKIGSSTLMPKVDRTFSEGYVIDEKFGLDGTYIVEVDAGGLYTSSKSFVVPEFGGIVVGIMLAGIASVVFLSSKFAGILPRV